MAGLFLFSIFISFLWNNVNLSLCFFFSATERLQQDWQMEFELQEMCEEIKNDGFIRIVCEQVLGMGKNVHLLHLLGKLHLVGEAAGICNSGKKKQLLLFVFC